MTDPHLDNCRDPESGVITPWAKKILSSVQEGYTEISPSLAGIHIIIKGVVREGGIQKKVPPNGKIEMYSRDRFFTVTGRIL